MSEFYMIIARKKYFPRILGGTYPLPPRLLRLCSYLFTGAVGIMVTSKQQHEFRIQLQKKACRRAEKKNEVLEDDVSWKEV